MIKKKKNLEIIWKLKKIIESQLATEHYGKNKVKLYNLPDFRAINFKSLKIHLLSGRLHWQLAQADLETNIYWIQSFLTI